MTAPGVKRTKPTRLRPDPWEDRAWERLRRRAKVLALEVPADVYSLDAAADALSTALVERLCPNEG